MAAIEFRDVTKRYGETVVLRRFSLCVEPGERIAMIGRSGCGKTTVLKLVNALLTPDEGEVWVNGENVRQANQILLRRQIGYVIQNVGLFPHLNIEKNIAYVPSLSRAWTKPQRKQEAARLLSLVGLESDMAKRYPAELSGGQKQRVGIARALAAQPKILLMDEPFGAVDEITRRSLQEELLRLCGELSLTVLFVTHDIREAMKIGSRVLVMDAGEISQLASPGEILQSPENEFVRELVSGIGCQ